MRVYFFLLSFIKPFIVSLIIRPKINDIQAHDSCMQISDMVETIPLETKHGKNVSDRTQWHSLIYPFKLHQLRTCTSFPFLPSFTHIHSSGQKWACFCSERGVLVPNVSPTLKSQCYCTANQQGNAFSPVSPACLEAPLSCQSRTSCQISEPFLLQISLLCLLVLLKERERCNQKKKKNKTRREISPVLLMSSTQLHENSITEHPPPSPICRYYR